MITCKTEHLFLIAEHGLHLVPCTLRGVAHVQGFFAYLSRQVQNRLNEVRRDPSWGAEREVVHVKMLAMTGRITQVRDRLDALNSYLNEDSPY